MKRLITQGFAPLGGGRNALLARHSAFTLAEVLITLGIIGIVAAMTIPTLITNNQEKGWQTAASTFEAKFGQALKVMNTQNVLAGLGSTENFVAELQRHMKIVKTCDNSKLTECFTSEINGARSVIDVADATTYENDESKPTKTNTLITADKLGQKTWGTNTMGLQFANGVSAIVAYNPRCSANPFNNNSITVGGSKNNITFDTDCVAMVYDVQAFKNPNELNKDIRTSSRATVGDGNCIFKIAGACVKNKPFVPNLIPKSECEKLIGSTYGINSCVYDEERWPNAIKICHDDYSSKLPTGEQLGLLADYLFDTSGIGLTNTGSGLVLNYDKAISLGLVSVKGEDFSLWSNLEGTSGAWHRDFGENGTNWNPHGGKLSAYPKMMCIK